MTLNCFPIRIDLYGFIDSNVILNYIRVCDIPVINNVIVNQKDYFMVKSDRNFIWKIYEISYMVNVIYSETKPIILFVIILI